MKSQKLRILLYIVAIILIVLTVQWKKSLVVKERSKEVVSLPNEIKQHGIPVDVEKVKLSEFSRSIRVTATQLSSQKGQFYFTKNERRQFHKGQEVIDIREHKLIGEITSVSNRPKRSTGLYVGTIRFNKSQSKGAVDIVIDKIDARISIPIDAVDSFREKNKNFVWTSREGKAQLVEVQLGEQGLGRVEIKKGLNQGDLVVTNGWKALEENRSMRIRQCQFCDKSDSGATL